MTQTTSHDPTAEWEAFYEARAAEYGHDWTSTGAHLTDDERGVFEFLRRVQKMGEDAGDRSVAQAAEMGYMSIIIGPEWEPNRRNTRATSIVEWASGILDRERKGALYSDSEIVRDLKESRRKVMEASAFDLTGLSPWQDDTNDSPVLWGDSSKQLALFAGRPTLIFGNDGAGKTTLAGLIAAGALGLDGYGTLLGHTVNPIPENEGVLILSFDGYRETLANYERFGVGRGTNRLTFYGGSTPWNPEEADATMLAAFVDSIEKERPSFWHSVVIMDNAQRAFGGVDRTDRASAFGNAVSRLESQGRSVIVMAQSRKNGKPSSKDDAMIGSLGLSGMGSIVSLHRTRQGDAAEGLPTISELRHHKGIGSNDGEATTVLFDLNTGRALLEEDDLTEHQLEQLEAWPTMDARRTSKELAAAWDISPGRARANILALEAKGLIAGDYIPGQSKTKHYWRLPQ